VVGLLSNGVHTNGYSLIRRILWEKNIPLSQYFPEFQKTLGEELLRVHKSYKKEILPLLPQIKTLAHITGGGFYDNIRRKLPKGKGVKIVKHSWQIPPVFKFIAKEGKVEEEEMFKVFNMGIGMVMIVEELSILTKLPLAVVIGEVIEKEGVYFV
jgi:phosphoribosylformylglycinamidine cyclo-ligase